MILRNSLTLGLAVITTLQLFDNSRPIIGYRQDDDYDNDLAYYNNNGNNLQQLGQHHPDSYDYTYNNASARMVPVQLVNDNKNNRQSNRNKNHNNRHYESSAVVSLFDWEIESIQGNRNGDAGTSQASCNPPFHISKQCCIGTFSTGGDIDYKQRHRCHATTLEQYQHLEQQYQHHELGSSSVPPPTTATPKCDICRILQIASERGLSIAFFGDSMTNQVVQGLECELQRRNYQVRDERVVVRSHNHNPPVAPAERNRDNCKRCIKRIRILHVSSPTLETDVTIKFFFQYRYPFQYPEEELEVATSADILILNLGLHWAWNGRMPETGRMHYRKSVADFLHFLKTTTNTTSSKLLIWRETSAQHFDADGGDWGLRTNTSSNQCVPIQNYTTAAAAWRESRVQAAAKAQGYRVVSAMDTHYVGPTRSQEEEVNDDPGSTKPELVILPWWNFTAQLHMMHPAMECTHYCYSPFLYLPLWKGLRLAMDLKYA
jgi:GDSL/SGNH-like Acyl-Esterase family found in Pmr5 and Cas1p